MLTFTKTNGVAQGYGMLNDTWFDGCEKTIYAYAEHMTDEIGATWESLSKAGILEFRTKTISLPEVANGRFAIAARLSYTLDEMQVHVTEQSYEELIVLFDVVQNPWKMQIFDKDGNRLISSAENGSVVRVVDAEGNTVWEAFEK